MYFKIKLKDGCTIELPIKVDNQLLEEYSYIENNGYDFSIDIQINKDIPIITSKNIIKFISKDLLIKPNKNIDKYNNEVHIIN